MFAFSAVNLGCSKNLVDLEFAIGEILKKLVLMGCYVSVKDDAFLSSLKNLKAVIPFISYSTIEELVTGKKSKFNLTAIARARKAAHESKEAKLTEYLESIQAPGK